MFTIKIDDSVLQKKVDELTRTAIPSAAMVATTRTATEAKKEVRAEMGRVFDRPTPYTLNSLFIRPATRTNIEAIVGIKTRSTAKRGHMHPEVYGGVRQMRASEKRLGTWWSPGQDAPLDQYGNVRGGLMRQILSQLQRSGDPQANETARSRKRNKAAQAKRYFAVYEEADGLMPGVYYRQDGALKRVLAFTRRPYYRRRLEFKKICERVWKREYRRQFDVALGQAVGRRLGRMM